MFKRELAKQLFKKSGRTKEWTANECGINEVTLSAYFHGRRDPSRAVLLHMARIWNVPVADLDDEAADRLAV